MMFSTHEINIETNKDRDIREGDGLCWFLYTTDRANGGGALCQSYHRKRPVRVFRSSILGGRYAPPFFADDEDECPSASNEIRHDEVAYRYDGLYMVRAIWDVSGRETEDMPAPSSAAGGDGLESWQTFFFTRLPKKPLEIEKIEEDIAAYYNALGLQELWSTIQKMKGVKRPKKFVIPVVPMKLPALRRGSVSGPNQDRKCPGRPLAIGNGANYKAAPPARLKSPEKDDDGSSSDEEIDENSSVANEPPQSTARSCEVNAQPDSDSEDEPPRRAQSTSVSMLHSSSQSNFMPRPRMNSLSSKAVHTKLPSLQSSSDSDSQVVHSAAEAPRIARRNNLRRTPSPSRRLQDSLSQSNSNSSNAGPSEDNSSNARKRTSATRAQAADRDMHAANTRPQNRRSASSSAAGSSSISAPLPKRSASDSIISNRRKRSRPARLSADDSSSEEESSKKPGNDIDARASALTVGSRLLVMYKDGLFKASVRKRRECTDGPHPYDFLIHYDGNKKTNTHWISVDQIKEILEINLNGPVPPEPKKRGGHSGKAKKDAEKKQEASNGRKRRRNDASKCETNDEGAVEDEKPSSLRRESSNLSELSEDEDESGERKQSDVPSVEKEDETTRRMLPRRTCVITNRKRMM